jgi:hypothetical protein
LHLIRTLSASVLLIVALAACVAPAKVPEEKDANGKKIEYVYYTPTGTSIPIRVRKDQLKTSDQEKAAEDRVLEQAQLSSTSPPPQAVNGPH